MVLNKSLRMEILKPHLIGMKTPTSTFKQNFKLCYYYGKLFGTIPYGLKSDYRETGQLDIGIISSLTHAIFILLIIQQSLVNTLNQLSLSDKRPLEPTYQNVTSSHVDHMRIFIAKFTHRADFFVVVAFAGNFLASIQMNKLVASLQRYFDQLDEDIGEQKKILPDVFETKKSDPTFKRSVQLMIALGSPALGSVVVSTIKEPTRAVALSWVYKFCKAFVKFSSLVYCLDFCVLCSMLEYHFVYINSVLRQISTMEKAYLNAWFSDTLNKVGIWHRTLCETLDEINRMCQIQSLLSILASTIHFLPHLFLLGIRILGSGDVYNKEYSFIQFLFGIRYILKIYFRCHFASKVTYEATKTKMHLSSFLMKHKDQQLLEQQMSCGNTSFQLCGLLTLNNSFFLSTMLAVVGYFIIILQSYMSEVERETE